MELTGILRGSNTLKVHSLLKIEHYHWNCREFKTLSPNLEVYLSVINRIYADIPPYSRNFKCVR